MPCLHDYESVSLEMVLEGAGGSEEVLGGKAGGGVVGITAEKAGYFCDALRRGKLTNSGFGAAVGSGLLGDVEVRAGLSGDTGEVRNEDNLEPLGQAVEESPHSLRGFAAEAGVYLV